MFSARWSILPAVCGISLLFALSTLAQTSQTSTPLASSLDEVDRSLHGQTADQALTGAPVSENVRRLHYELTLQLSEIYDSNISLVPNNAVDDFYTRIGAVLTLGFGDTVVREENFLELFYEPELLLFADHSDFDSVQHFFYLAVQYRFSRLTLGLAQRIELADTGDPQLPGFSGTIVNGVNIDTGGRRRINIYTTHLSATYELSGKTYLSSAGDYELYDYSQGLTNSHKISGDIFLNYRYSPKLAAGLGVTAGRNLLTEPDSDQTFEQANLRATYSPTGKISASVLAGVEFRQFDNGSGDYVSPVFDLNASYTPFDGTNITVDASRGTQNSASTPDQDYVSTQIQLTARQRLLQRVVVSLMTGYQNLDYFAASPHTRATRGDDYYYIEPSIDIRITNFWYAGAFFVYRQNNSNFSDFSFDDKQVGIRSALKF
jgi:hypothetical protein